MYYNITVDIHGLTSAALRDGRSLHSAGALYFMRTLKQTETINYDIHTGRTYSSEQKGTD